MALGLSRPCRPSSPICVAKGKRYVTVLTPCSFLFLNCDNGQSVAILVEAKSGVLFYYCLLVFFSFNFSVNTRSPQVREHRSEISVLTGLRWEDANFKGSLGYAMKLP